MIFTILFSDVLSLQVHRIIDLVDFGHSLIIGSLTHAGMQSHAGMQQVRNFMGFIQGDPLFSNGRCQLSSNAVGCFKHLKNKYNTATPCYSIVTTM